MSTKDLKVLQNKRRRRGRPSEHQSINKEDILKDALKSFADHGFNGVSISSISKKIGVNDSLLHYHFGNKESLWQHAVNQAATEYEKESKQRIKMFKDLDLLTLGKAIIRHFIYYTVKNPELSRIIMHEISNNTDRSNWLVENVLKPLSNRAIKLQNAQKEAGLLQRVIPEDHLLSILYGIYTSHLTFNLFVKNQFDKDVFEDKEIERYCNSVIEILENSLYRKSRS